MSFASDFLRGLTSPSLIAAAIAVGLGSLGPIAGVLTIDTAFIGANRGYFAGSSLADTTFVTASVGELQQADPSRPVVLLVGASCVRELVTSESDLRARLPEAQAYMVAGADQSLWDAFPIAASVPDGSHGLAMISVHPFRFSTGNDPARRASAAPRLGIRSKTLDEALVAKGHRVWPTTGFYGLDNLSYVLPRLYRVPYTLANGPIVWEQHRYTHFEPDEKAPLWHYRTYLQVLEEAQESEARKTLVVLAQLVEAFREKGLDVVFYLPPTDPTYLPSVELQSQFAMLERVAVSAAEEIGVPLWRPRSEVPGQHFADWCHLKDPASMEKLTEELVLRIREHLDQKPQ